MRRPDPLTTIALSVAAVLFAASLAYLLATPQQPTGRYVGVRSDGTVIE